MLKVATILTALGAAAISSTDAAEAVGHETIDAGRTLALMEKVADWQLAHLEPVASIKAMREETRSPRSWQQGAFYAGLTALAERSESPRFRDAVLAHGRSTNWQLGDRRYHADDHVIGQSYLWAATHGAGPQAIAPLRKRFDEILAAPPRGSLATREHESCVDRWCWCDALFMAPPVWTGLAGATGDQRYAAYAHAEFKATRDFLYDREEHLFYRDSRFFEQRDSNGRKLFWSRGNGWVFAGIARVLERLPASDPARPMYEDLFKEMAAKLKAAQKPDGYWSPSLLAAAEATPPESSGTGFFVYGMAWGIAAGLLDRTQYEPVARSGWRALERAVQSDGMLGWVQQVSDRPEQVAPGDTQFYGVGAFLLAGSAVHDLWGSTSSSKSFAQDAAPPLDGLKTWKPIIDARMRAEFVDQTPLAEDADAVTLRLRAGFESGKTWNTTLLAEGEFVTPLDGDYRPDPARATRTAFPVVADPESYEVNRLQLTNTTLSGTTLTLGRQRILLDDQRFVGNVGWRQNEQTFDAVRVVNRSIPKLVIDATYLDQVNRVFGPDSPQGRWHGDGWLGNVAWQLPIAKLTAFAYVLDFEPLTSFPGLSPAQAAALDPVRVSTATSGARLSGERASGSLKLGYAASYARQSDYGSNPLRFDLDYYLAEITGTRGRYGLRLGNEVLQGDGTTGFATPIATLHPFNGWADKFLTTPANGLDDRYAAVSYALQGASVLDALSTTVVYHKYSTQRLDADLGTEVNVQLQAKMKRFTGLIKYAAYEAHEGRTPAAYQDTTKLWMQLEYVW